MTAGIAPTTIDVPALVQAIENRDAEGQLAAYAPDAEIVVIDQDHNPSTPLIVRGTDALRAHLSDVCARDMVHEVTTAALAGDHLTVELTCRYPDGTKVACLCVSGIVDGQIAWQRGLQAWDH